MARKKKESYVEKIKAKVQSTKKQSYAERAKTAVQSVEKAVAVPTAQKSKADQQRRRDRAAANAKGALAARAAAKKPSYAERAKIAVQSAEKATTAAKTAVQKSKADQQQRRDRAAANAKGALAARAAAKKPSYAERAKIAVQSAEKATTAVKTAVQKSKADQQQRRDRAAANAKGALAARAAAKKPSYTEQAKTVIQSAEKVIATMPTVQKSKADQQQRRDRAAANAKSALAARAAAKKPSYTEQVKSVVQSAEKVIAAMPTAQKSKADQQQRRDRAAANAKGALAARAAAKKPGYAEQVKSVVQSAEKATAAAMRTTQEKKISPKEAAKIKEEMKQRSEDYALLQNWEAGLKNSGKLDAQTAAQIAEEKAALMRQNEEAGALLGLVRGKDGFWRDPKGKPETGKTGLPKASEAVRYPGKSIMELRQGKSSVSMPLAFTPEVVPGAPNVWELQHGRREKEQEARKEEAEEYLQRLDTVDYRLQRGAAAMGEKAIGAVPALLETARSTVTGEEIDPHWFGQEHMRYSELDRENMTRGMSGGGKFAADTAYSIVENAATMPLALVNPTLPLAMMGVGAAAEKTHSLNRRGISPGQALTRGLVSGGIEIATERVPIGHFLKILRTGGKGLLKNILKQAGIEATEESAAYIANAIADYAAKDPEAKFSLQELALSAAGGAISGSVFGVGGVAGNRIGSLFADTSRARPQPLPVINAQRNNISQNTAQNATLLPVFDAQGRRIDQSNPQTPAQTPQTGGQKQDIILPPVFDELGRRIDRNANPQTANQPQTAQERYEAQIDGTFDGSLSKAKTIELGRTPEILRSLGAPDLPLTMTQRVARKIAYPMGYLEGKHNLGIPALKKLPQQISDPLAVLVSKTQPNSYVVLTQWNDTDGNPVVAAIHMNKKGVIEDINALASAYGKRNLEALLGKNHENVVYTKENKSIEQLLSIRLQLPEAMADDTLVAHSIAQGIINVNQTANENQGVVLLPAFDELGQRIDRNAQPGTVDSQTLGQVVQDNQPQQSQPRKVPTMNDHIRNNRQLLAEHGVIAEVTGNEISGNRDMKISDRVMAFFESVGKRITRQGFGKVDVTDRGVKSSISHGIGPTKIAAFAAVPDVIRKGQIIDEQHDWKNRGFDTVVFGGRITIGGQLYDMGVVVKKYDNIQMPSKYYLHEVLLANEEGEATTFSTRTREGYPSEVALPSSDASITQKDLDVNPLDMEKGKKQGAETPGFRQTRQDGVIPLPRFDAQGRRIDNNPATGENGSAQPSWETSDVSRGELLQDNPARTEQVRQEMRERLEGKQQQTNRDADFRQRMNAAQNEITPGQPEMDWMSDEFLRQQAENRAQQIQRGTNPETAQNETIAPRMTGEEFAQAKNRLAELENSFTEADRQAIDSVIRTKNRQALQMADHPEQVQEYYQLWENSADYLAQQIQNAPAMTEEEFAQARNRLAELENSFTETDRQAVNELVHPDREGQQVLPDHPEQVREYHQLWERVVNHRVRQDNNARMRRQQADQQLAAEHQTGQNAQSDRMNIFTQTENGAYSPAVRQAVREEIQNIVRDARTYGANVAQHYPGTRSAVGLEASSAEQYVSSANDAVQNATSTEAHALRTTLRRLRDKLHMTPAEVRAAMEYASGRKVDYLTDENAHLRVSAYAEVLAEYNQVMRPTYDYWEQTQQARWKAADEFAQHSAEWTDAKRGVALDARTPERVLRKVCGKQADAMIESYIEPVHRHEAQKIKWINERMRQLEKVIKGVSRETGVYTHMKNRADWMERRGRDASQIQVKMAEYAEKHKGKINFDRVAAIEQGCIEITRAIYPEISEAYVANGYDALEFMEDYIPSNGVIHEGGAVAKFLRGAGIETMADELPTEISGTTADRRPGRTYFAAANQRTGYVTEFDLFKAMQNYVVQSADVIFHTGDIQNLRALEERIRYQYSDEATQADLDIADFEYKWDVDKRIQAKSSIWESTFGNLPHFPTWIREYTNLLAGKKLIGDRTTEHDIGRGFFRTINDVEAVAARSMLGGNVSTAISNFIALGQGSAELRARSIARAMYDYGYDQLKGDTAFRDGSAFLTRRGGVDAAYKTKGQRVNDALFLGMEAVDGISSNVLTRARYYDNMARGMDKTAAMREADAWAASLMGDRSKGSAPLLFQSKSFLKKLVTMFQLEPTNTLGHVFEDLPYEARQRGKAWLAKTLTELALMSFLMNDLWEKTTGRRPVQDPVGIVNEFVGKITGWCMPNTFDLLGWAMTGEHDKEELEDLFRTQKKDTGDAIIQTMEDAAGYVPIVGGMIGGAVGAKTSRFPMESIIPNVKELVGTLNHSGTPESRRATRLEELSKPVIGLILGGSQMRKTYKGAKMLLEGGQYGFSPQGERILKFPAYGQKPGAAEKAFTASQALLFGPTATARGQKYVRSGFMSLSADKTQIYERLVSGGMDGGKAFDTLLKMSGKMAENYENLVTKGEIDEDAARKAVWAVEKAEAKKGSGLSNKQAKREAIMALDLDWMEKSIVDKWLIGGGESGGSDYDSSRYSSKEIFEITNYVKKNRVQDALRMVREYVLDTRQAKKYAEIYDETDEEFYNLETKKRESIGKAQRLKIVLDQINGADDLDDKQKDGVKKILLLPELGEKYASDKAKSYIDGISIDQLIDAEYAYQTISDEVKADQTIHEKNRSEMTRVRFTQYLESTGMTRAQQDGLYYFRANGMTDLSKPWSEIIRLGDDDVQAAAPGLEMSGMTAEQYKVVKAGMDRIYADKDSKGESVDGSKKKKLIAYLSQWDLTDEQKDLLMRADGYKYGMGEKPKNSGRGRGGKGGRKSGGGSKGGGRKTPPTLPTLPTFKTPF